MLLKIDRISQWNEVLESIEKDHIPIDCVKKVLLKLEGGRQKTINLENLRKNGLDLEEIETVVSRHMRELGRQIANIEFIIDVKAVEKHVQPITDKFLSNL